MDLYCPANSSFIEYFDEESIQSITAKILALPTGMDQDEVEALVRYIETMRPAFDNAARYLARRQFQIPRTIEFDPINGFIFVHLKTHNISRVGKGAHKMVTYSLLYDSQNPQLVANASVKVNEATRKEVQALETFKGNEGIISPIYIAKHPKKSGKELYEIITPLYNKGSLKLFLKKNAGSVPLAVKIKIARDILKGASILNAQGYIMRDNHLGNIFVQKTAKGYEAVIGDLGGYTSTLEEALHFKPFGPSCRSAPPDILKCYLAGTLTCEDLLSYHVYALGRVLYECFYERELPWRRKYDDSYALIKNMYKDATQPDLALELEFLQQEIDSYTLPRLGELAEKEKSAPLSLEERYERIVLQMLSSDRKIRQSNAFWYQEFEKLLTLGTHG